MARLRSRFRSWRILASGVFAACSLGIIGFAGQAFAADVRLKANPSVETADIRLGDLFDGAGDASMTVFGMAPSPGRKTSYSAAYVQAKAKQAGVVWTNAENVATITIVRAGASPAETFGQNEAAAPLAQAASSRRAPQPNAPQRAASAEADLKRGDSVQIIYRAPGIELIAAGKATADASIGGKARAVNLRSNKPVDGVLVSSSRIEAYSLSDATSTQVAALDNGAQ